MSPLSPDGHTLATMMTDGRVKLWNHNGSAGPELDCRATCLVFSPDGKQLAVGDQQGLVTFWDPVSARATTTLPPLGQPLRALCFSPDGRRLASSCEGHLRVSEQEKILWDQQVESDASPLVIAFSHDGKQLATAGPSKVLLWSEL